MLAAALLCPSPLTVAQSSPAARRASIPTKRTPSEREVRSAQLAAEAQEALAAGRFAEAEAALAALAKLEPGVAEIQANLGTVYFQEGKFDAAVDSLRRALRLKPSLTRSRTLLALSLAELGNSKEALSGLEAGFRDVKQPEVQRQCGLELLRVYTALQRNTDAVATALALNKSYPDDGEVLYQTGRIYGNIAFVTMERLRDKAPDSVWMLQASAEARESEKKYDGALENYSEVLRIEPRRPGVHYRMGRVYLALFEEKHQDADRDAAEKQFLAELNLDPANGNAAYELAQLHHDEAKTAEARREFESLVAKRPGFEQAQVALAGILIEGGEPRDAVTVLRRAIALDPEDPVAWFRLARALRMTGDVAGQKQAVAEFQRLHALEGSRLARAGVLAPAGEVTRQQVDATPE